MTQLTEASLTPSQVSNDRICTKCPGLGPGRRDGETERPSGRWAPSDRLHDQWFAPGREFSLALTGLSFHHPDGGHKGGPGDVAPCVLSAFVLPEV